MFSKEVIALAKDCIEAIKKISKGRWEWKPKVGEWFITRGSLVLISEFSQTVWARTDLSKSIKPVPLLHWEDIELILKMKLGYWFDFDDLVSGYRVGIYNTSNELLKEKEGKSRQLAVMRAVIGLGKEIE